MLVEIGRWEPGLQAPIRLAYVQCSFCSLGDIAETMWIVHYHLLSQSQIRLLWRLGTHKDGDVQLFYVCDSQTLIL